MCCYVFHTVLVNTSGHFVVWYMEHTAFLCMTEVSAHKTTIWVFTATWTSNELRNKKVFCTQFYSCCGWIAVFQPVMYGALVHTRLVLLCFSLPSMYVTTAGVEMLKSPCCSVTAVMIVTTRFVSCHHFWKFLKVRRQNFFRIVCKAL